MSVASPHAGTTASAPVNTTGLRDAGATPAHRPEASIWAVPPRPAPIGSRSSDARDEPMAQWRSTIYDRAVAQGGAVGAGRSTAIVLFTDLVGSTELRSRLGEDAAEELRHKHDALVAAAVGAGRGNLVKNLGDGIMATFTGAADAVGAAVAIQQAIGRHNRSASTALEVRIGISAGDVVFETDDCFGTPVIEAARLCGAAGGGQILASEMVRWLARSCGGTFTPVGNLELKGLPESVPAVQVDWEPLPESSLPLPPFLTDIGRIFVGRGGELERLGQRWKEAMAGELRVALLAGGGSLSSGAISVVSEWQ